MVVAYNSLLSYPNFHKWQDKESSLKTMNLAGFNDFHLILIETIPLTLPTARKLPRIMNKVDFNNDPYFGLISRRTSLPKDLHSYYSINVSENKFVQNMSFLSTLTWSKYQNCTFSLEQIVEGFILNKNGIKEY